MNLILVLLAVGATLTIGYLWLVNNTLTRNCDDLREIYGETLDQALTAERDRTKAETELAWLKHTISVIAARNSIAVLTDEQAQNLVNAVAQLVISATKSPDRLN